MCDDGWKYFNTNCYKEFDINDYANWYDAVNWCKDKKSFLVSLHSVEEQNVIADMVDTSEYQHFFTWLGGKRNFSYSPFEWRDGTDFDYANFLFLEAEEYSCISMHRVHIFRSYFWVWMTDNCDEKLAQKIVCKKICTKKQ